MRWSVAKPAARSNNWVGKKQMEDHHQAEIDRDRSWQDHLSPRRTGKQSQVVIRKKFSRSQLLVFKANLPSSLIGMEAGVGSHFLGRARREQGHEVRLTPAQFVRPFVKSNKNDYRDAEAIVRRGVVSTTSVERMTR
jgi:transposase